MRSQSFLCGRAWRIAYLCLFLLLPIYAHPKPIQAYEQEIERLSRQGGSQAQLAQAYMELGIAQYEAEMPSRALGSLFTALGIAESIHNRQLVAHIRYRIGVVFYSLGQYYQALEHLHPLLNARFITEEEQVNTLVLIGNIYSGLGHYGRAISYLLEALYKLEHFGISEADIRIRVNYNLGNIYYEDQNYEEALLYYQKSLKMAHEQQALRWQCSIQAALGGVYKQTGKYAQALQHLGRAMELARELQDGNNLGYALLNMGITHGKMGQTELALSEIEEAEKLGVSQENLVLQMHCLKARGELFQQNGKLGQAVSTLRQALAISQSLKLQAGKEHILELLSQAYLQMGRLEKAYQVLRYEMKLKDSLYQGDISRIIDLRRNEYTIRQVEEKLVNERIERAHEQALQRIYWFGAGICLIFLCAILWLNYSRYRLQSKANQQLEAKNKEIKLSNEKLKESNKALEQFASIASHDLKEPLRMIGSFTSLLQQRYLNQLGEEAGEFMYFITDGVSRMNRLLDDLLDFARLSSRNQSRELTDMNELMGKVLKTLSLRIRENQAVVEVEPLPELWGNPSQLEQLFQNLLSNALKFRGVDPPHIRLSLVSKKNEYVFCLSDNGIGISPEHQKRIFHIFERLHSRESYEGTGIGLAICKKIVLNHQGRIWLESTPGKGTTFFIALPRISGETTPEKAPPAKELPALSRLAQQV